jgi:CBS domain-containing protein
LPAGPTIIDEVANAALFYGLMQRFAREAAEVPQRITFEDAKVNFFAAAQHGLDARFTWLDGRRLGARELLRQELIPASREGLEALQVPTEDIERYLGIIDARVSSGRTGARWLLDSLANVREADRGVFCRDAVRLMRERQGGAVPVHCWELIVSNGKADNMETTKKLGDVMTTNLFTVRPEDLVDLATSMMEWKHVRHVPVESAKGELVGLLSMRELLRLHSGEAATRGQPIPVSAIMRRDPLTMSPDALLGEAFERMLEGDSGCLWVVARGQLLGIVTERDLLEAAVALLSKRTP